MKSSYVVVAVVAASVLAGGCASRRVQPVPAAPESGYHHGAQYGVVHGIDTVRAESQTTGAGAVVGGAVGGLIGHQTHGRHRDVATAVGVVAGAVIGNQIEKNSGNRRDIYRVTVRTDQGELRSFDYASLNDLRVGDRVRIENNQLYRW